MTYAERVYSKLMRELAEDLYKLADSFKSGKYSEEEMLEKSGLTASLLCKIMPSPHFVEEAIFRPVADPCSRCNGSGGEPDKENKVKPDEPDDFYDDTPEYYDERRQD